MFSTKARGRKAFATEQKIREFKKLLLKSKRLHKATTSRCLEPQKLIRMAVNVMNKVTLHKYGFSTDFVEEKASNDKKFHEIYDFHRLVKVQKHAERYEHSGIRSIKRFHRKLRSLLEVGKKVLALAERLRKKKRCA